MPDSAQPQDIFAAISAARGHLSPKLSAIASYALDQTEQFIRKTSKEICAELKTSEPTLIKFCQSFGFSGLSDFRIDLALALAQNRGGSRFVEPLARDRRQVNQLGKTRIARAAAELVAKDRSLLIDNGSTAEAFAQELGDLPSMTVMTNGIFVAQNVLQHEKHTVMLAGGRIRPNAMSMSGPLVETCIQQMRFDTFVMGAASLHPQFGVSTFQEDEAHATRRMMDAAERVIVLADKTKLLKPALHLICQMSQIDILVTDLPKDDPSFTAIEAQGIEVVSALASKEQHNEIL